MLKIYFSKNSLDIIKNLDGEFLIIILTKNSKIQVFNDRFASYPFYWACQKDCFVGSYNYIDLAKIISRWKNFKLSPERAFQFIVTQRLLGEFTHDNLSKCLQPASFLSWEKEKINISSYWKVNYKKNNLNKKQLVENFLYLLENSIRIRSSNLDRVSDNPFLFLSGGHDSRLIAAFSKKKMNCVTLGYQYNFEVKCKTNCG